jgi:hypothetical protein
LNASDWVRGAFFSLSARSCSWVIICITHAALVQAIHRQTHTGDKQQALYNLFAAYIHNAAERADRKR